MLFVNCCEHLWHFNDQKGWLQTLFFFFFSLSLVVCPGDGSKASGPGCAGAEFWIHSTRHLSGRPGASLRSSFGVKGHILEVMMI